MSAISESRIKQLFLRMGDEGACFYKRDVEKVISLLVPTSKETAQILIKSFLEACSLQHGKAEIYAYFLCRLQELQSDILDVLFELIISRLQEAVVNPVPVMIVNLLTLLGQCAYYELLNIFSFIGLLMQFITTIDKYPKTAASLLRPLLSVVASIRDFLIQKHPIEFQNLIGSIDRILTQLDASYSFPRLLLCAIRNAASGPYQPPNLLNRQIRKTYELNFDMSNEAEPPLSLLEALYDQKLVSELSEVLFVDSLRWLGLSYSTNPSLLVEKLLVFNTLITPIRQHIYVCDVLLALCGEDILYRRTCGYVTIDIFLTRIDTLQEIFYQRFEHFELCLSKKAELLSLKKLGILARNIALIRNRFSILKAFSIQEIVTGPFGYLLQSVQMEELSLTSGLKLPIKAYDSKESFYIAPLLEDVVTCFFNSSLSGSFFEQFIFSYGIEGINRGALSLAVIRMFLNIALKSSAHIETYFSIHEKLIRDHVGKNECAFLDELAIIGTRQPRILKHAFIKSLKHGFVSIEALGHFCLDKLLEERPIYSKILVELILYAEVPELNSFIKEAINIKPSSFMKEKIMQEVF